MKLAKITGTVVATRKDESLVGYKLMIIRKINGHGEFIGEEEVAVDYVTKEIKNQRQKVEIEVLKKSEATKEPLEAGRN